MYINKNQNVCALLTPNSDFGPFAKGRDHVTNFICECIDGPAIGFFLYWAVILECLFCFLFSLF